MTTPADTIDLADAAARYATVHGGHPALIAADMIDLGYLVFYGNTTTALALVLGVDHRSNGDVQLHMEDTQTGDCFSRRLDQSAMFYVVTPG